MKYKFEFKLPGRILCVEGGASRLGRAVDGLGGGRVLIVTDRGVRNAGLVDAVASGMGRGSAEVVGVFDEVPPNPDTDVVMRCRERALEREADCLVSVGGGSVIDTAKAALIAVAEEGRLDYQVEEYEASRPVLPHVAIPTTAGTGSESTHISMIVEREQKRKLVFHGTDISPRLAVLDPLMTTSLPPGLTASTGIDALTHAIEGLHSLFREPLTDGLAIEAIGLIAEYLERAHRDGDDVEARMNMLLAANMAGITASNAFVGIIHAMAHSIGTRFDVPHGVAAAVMLPYGMEYNLRFDYVPDRYRRVAAALGLYVAGDDDLTASRNAIDCVRDLSSRLGLPQKLREVGIPEDGLEAAADDSARDRCMIVNPGDTTPEELLEILKSAY